jgi:Putative beta-lactamase-inhibitor-like, PepSY-like
MTRFLTVPVLVIGLSGFAACAEEKDVPLDKVPEKVLAAVKKHFPDAKLVEVSTDTEDGVTEYTVTLHHNKHTYEVTVTEDGKITEIAREMEFKDLPKPVAAAFRKQHPKAKVDGVWELTEPGVKGKKYQIDFVTAGGKEMVAEFDADGKLLSEDDA